MHTGFAYLRIYTNLQQLHDPFDHPVEAIKELPYELNISPLRDASISETFPYVYDSVETLYVSKQQDLKVFLAKLSFLIRYSPWQPDAESPGPFRELLWKGNYIKSVVAQELLADFAAWDKDFRTLRDNEFYRVYRSLQKALLKAALGPSDKLNLSEFFIEHSHTSKPNSIQFPFGEAGPNFGKPEEAVVKPAYMALFDDSAEI